MVEKKSSNFIGFSSKLPTDIKRTRSEFVSKDMRRVHAKDVHGETGIGKKISKIEESESDSDGFN